MSFTTNNGRYRIWDRTIDLVSNTLKVMLCTSSYVPDKDHVFVSSVTNELSGTGYAGGFAGSGRKTLASKALAVDHANDLAKLTADNVTWPAINAGTVRYAVIIKEVTTDADSLVIAVIDVNPTAGIVTDGNDFNLNWGANGVLQSKSP